MSKPVITRRQADELVAADASLNLIAVGDMRFVGRACAKQGGELIEIEIVARVVGDEETNG